MPVDSLVVRTWARSRRLRRVVWTAGSLVALALIGGLVSWRIHKENAPQEYTPGEASQDITSQLSMRTAPPSAVQPQPGEACRQRPHRRPASGPRTTTSSGRPGAAFY